jgi:hypothetical protein
VNHRLRIKTGGGGYYFRLVWCCSQRDTLVVLLLVDRGPRRFGPPIRSQKEEAMSSVSGAAGHAALTTIIVATPSVTLMIDARAIYRVRR